MRAISLWQPWASLWMLNVKAFETRHWATGYRGPLAIHAAQRVCRDIDEDLTAIVVDQFGSRWYHALPRGAILGRARLVNCHPTEYVRFSSMTAALHGVVLVSEKERTQGNFEVGRFAWEIADRVPLEQPAPWKGHQGFFQVPPHVFGMAEEPRREGELF